MDHNVLQLSLLLLDRVIVDSDYQGLLETDLQKPSGKRGCVCIAHYLDPLAAAQEIRGPSPLSVPQSERVHQQGPSKQPQPHQNRVLQELGTDAPCSAWLGVKINEARVCAFCYGILLRNICNMPFWSVIMSVFLPCICIIIQCL